MRSFSYGRWRKSISAVIAAAMLLSLVVVPASGVPTPSTPAALSAGTTGVTSVIGTNTAGLTGVYDVEIVEDSTKTKAVGDDGIASILTTTVAGAGVTGGADGLATITVGVNMPRGTSVVNTISVNCTQTMVPALIAAIGNTDGIHIVGSVTDTVTIEHDLVGNYSFGPLPGMDPDGLWYLIFAGMMPTVTLGDYNIVSCDATFTPTGGVPAAVTGSTLGCMQSGSFLAGEVDTSTGEYSVFAIDGLADGVYYLSAPGGLKTGTLSFSGTGGVRDAVVDPVGISQNNANDCQAGEDDTLTAVFGSDSGLDAINGMSVTVPGGFEFKGGVIVKDDGTPMGSVATTITADKKTLTVTGFVSDASLYTIEAKIKTSTDTADDGKKCIAKTRNVGGTAWANLTVNETLVVNPNKTAGFVDIADVEDINAGGQTFVDGVIYDKYGNVDGTWGHSVQFAIQAPSSDATMVAQDITFSAARSQIDTMTFGVLEDGEFDMWFQTATTSGVNTLTVTVDHNATVKEVIVIDTSKVGDPAKLEVFEINDRYSFPDTDTAHVRVRVLDEAGNPTSYDFDNVVKLLGTEVQNVTILARRSDSGIINIAGATDPRVEMLAAFDYTGYAAMSDWVSIEFVDTSVFDDQVYEVILSAQPDRALVNDFQHQGQVWSVFHSDSPASFAYAKAGVGDSVEYTGQLVNELGQPVALAGQTVTLTIGPYDSSVSYPYPGKLSAKTAVTDENGQFTFSVSSEVGSMNRSVYIVDEIDGWAAGWYGSEWTPIGVDVTCTAQPDGTPIDRDYDGYAHVFFSKVSYQSASCEWEQSYNDALANGEDEVRYNFKYMWRYLCEPATGQEVNFMATLGTVDPETAVVGDDGWAHVAVTSEEAGDGTLYRFGPSGDYGELDYSFKDYKFVIDVLNELTPGGRNVQTGCDSYGYVYGDLLMRLIDKNGDTVYLARGEDGDALGSFSMPDMNSCRGGFPTDQTGWVYEIIDGQKVAKGYRFKVFNTCPKPKTVRMRDGYISNFVPADTYVSDSTAQDIDDVCAPADCDFDFVNEAKLSCTIDYNKSMFGKILGSGFPKFIAGTTGYDGSSDSYCVQYRKVGTQDTDNGKDGGNWTGLRQQIHFEPDGTVNDWIVGTITDPCGDDDWLPAGVYDLKVQGNVFHSALTVIGEGPGRYKITTPGISEGQVFYPGKLTQDVIAVNGEAALPLDWCALFVDGIKIGDSNENVPYSTTFKDLDFSYLQPGRHTFTVQYESLERYQNVSSGYWQEYDGIANINFYIKPKAAMTAKAVPTAPSYNTTYTVAGAISSPGSALYELPVVVQKSADGKTWTSYASVKTNAAGSFSFAGKSTATTYYKITCAGSDSVRATSKILVVKPKAALSAPISATSMVAGRAYSIYGTLRPKHTAGAYSVYVYVYKKVGTRWVYVKRVAAKNSNTTTYSKYICKTALAAGTYRLQARHADASHALTLSSFSRTITVK